MNNYEVATITGIGEAHKLILSIKPEFPFHTDTETFPDSDERIDDIDESED
jgi:hypothetical protein